MTEAPQFLLATDLDGTLLDRSGSIRRVDIEAARALEQRGVLVTIATGRMFSGSRHVAQGLGVVAPIACVDGAHIVEPQSGATLLMEPLPPNAMGLLREACNDERICLYGFGKDVIRHGPMAGRFASFVSSWTPKLELVDDVLDVADWDGLGRPVAMFAIGPARLVEDAATLLSDATTLELATFDVSPALGGGLWGLVVRSASASKGVALHWLAKRFGVPIERTIAVGDWLNDVSMLEVAGHSFAMAQAPTPVKKAAKVTLHASVDTGGALREIGERLGLL